MDRAQGRDMADRHPRRPARCRRHSRRGDPAGDLTENFDVFDLTLSFDNGPEPDVTPQVLDTLARRGIKTTFFVIGEKLADPARRRLAERAHGEGHWIGNHTYTHSLPLGLQRDPDAARHEIARTQGAIGDLAHLQRWFRPFGGGGNLDD